ncbi:MULTISPECIES: GTPase Era [unclassified Colwellia]|uniref:GTPase Era n=1 Tax=unclassified Colwellia TaxID=196834 RepID=UPI0015F76041|nr:MULTISPECIES: GTPase Era [unclassified Colwellia]MBA6233302.1 GTPase Era [Colwellia sp. MB02u-7]MBA6236392.1 GTPase Era [Colwellia sp. MB02u-11]MBA6256926.1 GTPase Era [Colwellia sp. MB3u-28]MBA6261068.1 GTPase Era [Colwellia sp. MB3u-41]MBA6298208.1 GTPase Era [Colwellia sp. MB3u-22]
MTSENKHCGLIAIVGRPNVGKSTLLNSLLGQKISITSRKPQTTRHRILGILTEKNKQAVLVDTPGLHSDEKRAINRLMNRAASSSIAEVELVVFLVEGTHWTTDDELVLSKIKKSGARCILVINKIDNVQDKESLLPHLQKLGEKHNFSDIVPISAAKGDNVDTIRQLCLDSLPEGDFWFPDDYVTDRSSRFMASEIIREKLIRFTGDELPYSTTVEVEQFKMDEKGIIHINALILVERKSQKRMVIGNKGERLKTIGQEARRDMEALFEQKVFLETWVKVKSGWADDERALRSLGYGDEYSG